ncbi:MAG: hypothetical protein MJ212_01915 [Alphaproteobacteria bacterium]|nr:hypothetical protein [Alphaproteobacteria bacterium]
MSGTIQNNLITVRQGDSFAINICVRKACKPVDLTGATLLMQVKDAGGNVMFAVNGTAVDVVHGKMALLLTPSETNIAVGDYVTDIQLTGADGSVNTIFPANVNAVATFRVTPQVTEG